MNDTTLADLNAAMSTTGESGSANHRMLAVSGPAAGAVSGASESDVAYGYDNSSDHAPTADGVTLQWGEASGRHAHPGRPFGGHAYDSARSLVAPGSISDDASRAVFEAADNVDSFSIKPEYLPGGGGKYSKFDYGVDPKAAIREAPTSDAAQFLPNPHLPSTFRVVTDLARRIGTKGQTSIRVIVGMDGQVINAFPVKVR